MLFILIHRIIQATKAGNIITIVGNGSSIITASQASTTDYIAGSIAATIVVSLPLPTIGKMTLPAKTFGNAPFSLIAPTSNSAGSFTYTSSNVAVAKITGNTITILKIGSSIITAIQAGNTSYTSGTITSTLVVTLS